MKLKGEGMANKWDLERFSLYKQIVDGIKFTKLFENVGKTYYFKTEEILNTNTDTMAEFIIDWKVPVEAIDLDDGSMVIIKHPTFDFKLRLDASGDGDFTHHKVETSITEY